MTSTDTVEVPTVDTAEGKLWREILAYDDTTSVVVPAGGSGMLMGGSAFSPPLLAARVKQSDVDEGVEYSTNTEVGHVAYFSLINTTPKGRSSCVDLLREDMDKYRHLAVGDDELARWVLYSLMVYVMALWVAYSNAEEVTADIGLLQQKLAGIRADIAG